MRSKRWLTVKQGAEVLGMSPDGLRRAIERAARRGADGNMEAEFDGVVARRIGRRWRVTLSSRWTVEGGADAAE